MPRLSDKGLTPVQASLLNSMYTLTLSACEQTTGIDCRQYDVFISSGNIRNVMGAKTSSSYQNRMLKELCEAGWLKRVKRFEGYPNGCFFYALTNAALFSLDEKNRAVGFLIVPVDDNRNIAINGQNALFNMNGGR